MNKYESLLNEFKSKKYQLAKNILNQKYIQLNAYKMRFDYFIHGDKPKNGYALIFGFHGGGGCPFEVNQQQWNNHKHLYDGLLPSGSIWFVPRSAEQASDMWWKDYIPEFITLLTQCFSMVDMIDTNRVFITGYSAGGDGIYHVASMMADLLAGATMMAGHPNKADIYNLRNLTFAIHVGENDNAYDRKNWGQVYQDKIDLYSIQYGGFKQYSQIHRGMPHWMNKRQAAVFPSFFNQPRNPYPQFILFKQHPRTFKRTFYYLKVEQKHKGLIIVRRKHGQNIFQIQCQQKIPITLMLNSRFVNFSNQIKVYYNHKQILTYTPKIDLVVVKKSIQDLVDPWYIFQDEIICMPQNDLPINYTHLRSHQLQHTPSIAQHIKQMEQNIVQGDGLHVYYKNRNKIQSLKQKIEARKDTRSKQYQGQQQLQSNRYKYTNNRRNNQRNIRQNTGQKLKRSIQECCIIC